jgi:hypothetical protein
VLDGRATRPTPALLVDETLALAPPPLVDPGRALAAEVFAHPPPAAFALATAAAAAPPPLPLPPVSDVFIGDVSFIVGLADDGARGFAPLPFPPPTLAPLLGRRLARFKRARSK